MAKIGLIGYCLILILSSFNTPVSLYTNTYGNKLVFILLAIIGILSTVDISFMLEESVAFNWLGQNSIIIYITHFRILDVLILFFTYILNANGSNHITFLTIFILLILIEIPIIWFSNKYVPFLFGKKKVKKQIDTI